MFSEFHVQSDWGREFHSGTRRENKDYKFVTVLIRTEVLVQVD